MASHLKPACVGLILLAAALAAGCNASGNDKAVVAQAGEFHQTLAPATIKDNTIDSYFQTLGARIVAAAQRAESAKVGPSSHWSGDTKWMFEDIHFYLVNSKTLNAFTTGGHSVYVYNALLQLCENEEQLAAVMAHEYAHIYCRHVQKGMNNQMVLAGFAAAMGGAGYLAGGSENGASYAQSGMAAGAAVGKFFEMGFTRKDEAQADEYGQKFYAIAGYDPNKFGDFFAVMKAKVGDVANDLTSDHPSLASRIQIARERGPSLQNLRRNGTPQPVVTQAQFVQIQQLAKQDARQTPDDKQVLAAKTLLQALPRSCWVPFPQEDQEQAQKVLIEKAQANQKAQPAPSK